jgi:hypothetical protein
MQTKHFQTPSTQETTKPAMLPTATNATNQLRTQMTYIRGTVNTSRQIIGTVTAEGVTVHRLKACKSSVPTYHIIFLNILIINSLNYIKHKRIERYYSAYQHRQSSSSCYLRSSVSETILSS